MNDATSYERFPNAPIVEALLDIRVELPATTTLETLKGFAAHAKDRFPTEEQQQVLTAQFHLSGERVATDSRRHERGFLHASEDGTRMVQARLDGFTVNHLEPYNDWPELCADAKEYWARYIEVASPTAITRIALRFVNRILLPLPITELKDFVLTAPDIAPGAPQSLAGYEMQLLLTDEENEANIAVSQKAFVSPTTPDQLPLLFDIDVFAIGSFPTEGPELWERFDRLRAAKNRVFFESLTERTKEMFR
ncbi:MAG: TIGR04255 family protein [Myxococcota bacterium]